MEHGTEQHTEPLTLRAGPAWLWAALLAVGLAGWAVSLASDPAAGNRAMLVNFMFFTPLAAGLVAWPAVVRLARGRWMGSIEATALRGIGFVPVSLLAFTALFLGREHWAEWMHKDLGDKSAWLNVPFLFGRDAVALVVLWVAAVWFVWRSARRQGPASQDSDLGNPPRPATTFAAATLVILYCVVFSLLGFDLVMALDPHWFSSLFGGYVFISGMYAAVAAWTLLVLLSRPAVDVERRRDLAKLIVAFSMLTAYFMYSQLNVIWYENLPEESRFIIPRLTDAGSPWRWVSAGLLATAYLGPLVLLLTRWAKESRWFLGAVCGLILASLWAERWWLVAPTLGAKPVPGLVELSLLVAFAAAFVLSTILCRRLVEQCRPSTEGDSP